MSQKCFEVKDLTSCQHESPSGLTHTHNKKKTHRHMQLVRYFGLILTVTDTHIITILQFTHRPVVLARPQSHSIPYLAHVEGEAEEDQVQGAPLHQHT